ncbi:MAG: AAA family ATPase [Deltaproteobacteria bacterium]|nr:AAA family ATPase [Deltaproteobacteria bacterium]
MIDQEIIIQAMLDPETYPETPEKITHLQTHISHIFLTGGLVYKIKKPVDFGFLDFTTLARRRYFCQQEVMLNRRLTENVYLGVVKISSHNRRLVINGKGAALEYAVLMREMPQERMMDRLLRAGRVQEKDVLGIVRKLVPFYQKARTGKGVNPFGRIEIIRKNTEENFIQTQSYIGRLINSRTYDRIASGTRNFLKNEKNLFKKRIQEGRIRDCHGDLHSANICLEKKVQIFDCIEFNHRFRYSDIACDLAFLSMDLDFHGYPELSKTLMKEYVRRSEDHELPRLFNFYKAYRAYVRAKVHSFSSDNGEISFNERKAHTQSAKKYYRLAYEYIKKTDSTQLIVVFGLMGTGKTSLAQKLAKQTGWPSFSSDEIRKTLKGIPPTTRKRESFGKGIYSERMSRRTYSMMREQAQKWLKQGRSVILDGSYKRQNERLDLLKVAEKNKARIQFLECRAPLNIIRQRLDRRVQDPKTISDGRWELFNQQRKDFDPIDEPVKSHLLRIQTIYPVEQLVQKVIRERQAHV